MSFIGEVRICDFCSQPFEIKNHVQRFCNDRCRDLEKRRVQSEKLRPYGYPQCPQCKLHFNPTWGGEQPWRMGDKLARKSPLYCRHCLPTVDWSSVKRLLVAYQPCKRCVRAAARTFNLRKHDPVGAIMDVVSACPKDQSVVDLFPPVGELSSARCILDQYDSMVEARFHMLVPELVHGGGGVQLSNGHLKFPDFSVRSELCRKKVIEVHGDFWHRSKSEFLNMGSRWPECRDVDLLRGLYSEVGYQLLVVWENDVVKNPAVAQREAKDFLRDS